MVVSARLFVFLHYPDFSGCPSKGASGVTSLKVYGGEVGLLPVLKEGRASVLRSSLSHRRFDDPGRRPSCLPRVRVILYLRISSPRPVRSGSSGCVGGPALFHVSCSLVIFMGFS